MYSLEEAFEIAISHEKAGRLAEASVIYRNLASAAPHFVKAKERLDAIIGKWTALNDTMKRLFPDAPVPNSFLASAPQIMMLNNSLPARHKAASYLASTDDDPGQMNDRLFNLVTQAITLARTADFGFLDARESTEPRWYRHWPGEHYAFLAGLFQVLKPRLAIEIGTFTGMASLTMAANLPAGGQLVTFDVMSWDKVPNTWLRQNDLSDGRICQVIANLSVEAQFQKHIDLIRNADFFLIDAPKDHYTEQCIISFLEKTNFVTKPIVMFDDTRFLNMIDLWRKIARPKMDVTSFAHWCGSGVVDWCG